MLGKKVFLTGFFLGLFVADVVSGANTNLNAAKLGHLVNDN